MKSQNYPVNYLNINRLSFYVISLNIDGQLVKQNKLCG